MTLTISESGAQAIRGLLAAVGPADRSAIRISGPAETDGRRYELTASREPLPGDRTIDQRGVQLFIDPGAAPTLEGKVLDARVRGGTLRFALEDEPR